MNLRNQPCTKFRFQPVQPTVTDYSFNMHETIPLHSLGICICSLHLFMFESLIFSFYFREKDRNLKTEWRVEKNTIRLNKQKQNSSYSFGKCMTWDSKSCLLFFLQFYSHKVA